MFVLLCIFFADDDVARWRSGRSVGSAAGENGFIPSRFTVECHLEQVAHTRMPLSPSSIIWYRRKVGSKQAHHATHWTRVRGLAASAGACLRVAELEISAALLVNFFLIMITAGLHLHARRYVVENAVMVGLEESR